MSEARRRHTVLVTLVVLLALLVVTGPARAVDTTAASGDPEAAAAAHLAATPFDRAAARAGTQLDRTPLHVVLANVGNVAPACTRYASKLCLRDVEQRVAASLADLDPDVVGLIEVLDPETCARGGVPAPWHVCAGDGDVPQVERLLAHDDYTIVCGERVAWDCLAVRTSLGAVAGCAGGYCGRVAPTLPAVEGCWGGSQTLVVDTVLRGAPLTVVVAHPHARDLDCRAAELEAMFAAVPATGETLVLGDLNVDPWRHDDRSVAVFHAHVGTSQHLQLRSGPAEHDPPYGTVFPFELAQLAPFTLPNWSTIPTSPGRTIDHVLATAATTGHCTTLGEAPGTTRLDGDQGGMDHRAISCHLAVGDPSSSTRRATLGTS